MLPSFFGKAVKFAPAKNGARQLGASPLDNRFTMAVQRSSISSLCSVPKQFLMWIGLRPDGPPPDRRWKDLLIVPPHLLLLEGPDCSLGFPEHLNQLVGWEEGAFPSDML